jgi:superfamily II DNA or RNA helicase
VEQPVEVVSAPELRELIARAYLAQGESADDDFPRRMGSVTLHPHQFSAARRLLAAIEEFGGALLSDEVGMGKTFVALAIARQFRSSIVVGPAALRDMWSEQARRAGVELPFLSLESLSRKRHAGKQFDLVVIDEAHHFRNPSTARYRHVARMVMRSKVLLLSATPIHNSRRDLASLLALFIGSRAESLTGPEIGRCVVRRQIESAGLSDRIPEAEALVWKEIEDDDVIPRELLSLPPPVPVRDGGDGGALVARSLLRQWCSSDAALESALRRRLARSIALRDALECGRYPSEQELAAWTFAEDSVQLAFPLLVASPVGDGTALLDALNAHDKALRRILTLITSDHHRDAMRAEVMTQIRSAHRGVSVIAFSQYAETVRALFHELRTERGVGSLTATAARVAGGAITRREALARFAPVATGVKAPRYIDRIDLLLTTDLLSEGVNLQDAGVVVHLDLPWTAARLEQRIGRVRRLGSVHRRVQAYGIRPSTAAEALISLEKTIRTKMREAQQTVGAARPLLPEETPDDGRSSQSDPITALERIRSILEGWCSNASRVASDSSHRANDRLRVAATASKANGFLALGFDGSRLRLLACEENRVTESPKEILRVLLNADGEDVSPPSPAIAQAQERLRSWFQLTSTVGSSSLETANVARVRRKALRRISSAVESARPHVRQQLLNLAEHARVAVLGTLGAAGESDLLAFASSELSDEKWLQAVIQGAAPRDKSDLTSSVQPAREGRIIALLLLDNSCDSALR